VNACVAGEVLRVGECLFNCRPVTAATANSRRRRLRRAGAASGDTPASTSTSSETSSVDSTSSETSTCAPHYLVLREDGSLALYRGSPPPGEVRKKKGEKILFPFVSLCDILFVWGKKG
jgi:hypothetical protein